MNPFSTCVFVALVAGGMASPAAVSQWTSFKAKHAKSHAPHEDAARMARFLDRDASIRSHNERFAAGLESYSRQHNQYSDLSAEEFARSALGFVAAVNHTEIPMSMEPAMPSLPTRFDWRDQGVMTPVTNQGYCGSCYAFAGTGALEGYLKWKKGASLDLSEQEIVDCSYKKFMGGAHNGGCSGGWPTAVFDHVNVKDIVHEHQYAYTSGRSQTHGSCRMPSPVNQLVRNRLKVKNIRTRSEDEMAQILMAKGPLVIAMAADNEYKQQFADLGDGVFDQDNAINVSPNHAVVLVGFGNQNGKDYWVIKNSWGKEWGVGGYGKIRRGRNMCALNMFGVWYVEE